MASTDLFTLADAAYASLTQTRYSRAVELARAIPPGHFINQIRAGNYDAAARYLMPMVEHEDRLTANRIARRQHDAIAQRRAQQNVHALEDRRIERAVALQPRLGKVA